LFDRPHFGASPFHAGFVSSENGFVGLPMTEAHPGRIEQETREGPRSVSFQVAHGNARYACNLQTEFPTEGQAKKYLLTHWLQVEKMARDYLESAAYDGGEVKLVTP
jgi:hypothetical protein